MKKIIRFGKKVIAGSLMAVMCLGSLSAAFTTTAKASDTLPYLGSSAKGANQAYSHGYRCEDILDWSPATDPYAKYLKAEIPLQNRIQPFSATQAHPELSADVDFMVMAGDYGNSFFDSYNYTNEFSQYEFNYWQYISTYGSWHGQPTEEVNEKTMYVDERGVTDAWKNRKFEFGVVNLPNGGYTNAAHKNGVMSLGCIFVPRTGLHTDVLLTKDSNGKYIYADKLAEMCAYFGFDGYFLNLEEALTSSLIEEYKKFIQYCTNTLGLYIQWYDGPTDTTGAVSYQNALNGNNDSWLIDSSRRKVADSIFLNYWWSKSSNQSTRKNAESLGLDPYTAVYTGIEAGGDRWQQQYDLRNLLDNNGKALTSIVSLGSEFVHDGLDEDLDNGANNNVKMRREKDDYQWMTFLRERIWWSGAYADPSLASCKADRSKYTKSGTGIDYQAAGIANTSSDSKLTFDGVAAYVTEKSVIDGYNFVTDFNTGHGMEWRKNGQVISSDEWSNITLQDILPTWQWWIEKNSNVSRLSVDFDYGPSLRKTLKDGKSGSFDFNSVGAYNGADSLVVSGPVNGKSFLHLYKTDLDVTSASKFDVTFRKSSKDNASMKLGLIFADNANARVELDIPGSSDFTNGQWVTSSVDLSAYAGRKIAAFGLVFDSASSVQNYQMNVGEMKLTAGTPVVPQTPSGLAIEKAYSTGEMTLTWNLQDYNSVKLYHIYATYPDGSVKFLGGTYDDVFYVKNIGNMSGLVEISLYSVSEDGTESTYPATVLYDYSKAVKNVTAAQSGDKLTVVWTDSSNASRHVEFTTLYKGADKTVTASAESTGNTAVITVPTGADADYTYYLVTVYSADGSNVSYEGKLADTYCAPYSGSVIKANSRITAPLTKDWNKLTYRYVTSYGKDGSPVYSGSEKTVVRANGELPTLPSNYKAMQIVLEDYSGNRSARAFLGEQPAVVDPQPGDDDDDEQITINAYYTNLSSLGTKVGNTDNMVDGDESTSFIVYKTRGNLGTGYVAVDLGKTETIHGVTLPQIEASGVVYKNNKVVLEVLKDSVNVPANASSSTMSSLMSNNSNWTVVASDANNAGNINATGRYFRIRIDSGFTYYPYGSRYSYYKYSAMGLSEIIFTK